MPPIETINRETRENRRGGVYTFVKGSERPAPKPRKASAMFSPEALLSAASERHSVPSLSAANGVANSLQLLSAQAARAALAFKALAYSGGPAEVREAALALSHLRGQLEELEGYSAEE